MSPAGRTTLHRTLALLVIMAVAGVAGWVTRRHLEVTPRADSGLSGDVVAGLLPVILWAATFFILLFVWRVLLESNSDGNRRKEESLAAHWDNLKRVGVGWNLLGLALIFPCGYLMMPLLAPEPVPNAGLVLAMLAVSAVGVVAAIYRTIAAPDRPPPEAAE